MNDDVTDLPADVLTTLADDGIAVCPSDIFEADPRWAVDDEDLDDIAAAFAGTN
uniref:hypothetical protein n=1 Tax=Methylobacterium sp. B34 TaxID=95563 RepID=UPI001650FC1C|nr:hypothetical protein [Methylobacterium sp. B34]